MPLYLKAGPEWHPPMGPKINKPRHRKTLLNPFCKVCNRWHGILTEVTMFEVEQALKHLNTLIEDGWEFPEALWKAGGHLEVGQRLQLVSMYDAQ
jgi:hypothetical protein